MNIQYIDDYLGMGQSQAAERLCQNLATLGPALVEDILHRTLFKLRSSRDSLDDTLAGPWAAMAIKQVFDRAADIILEIIKTTPQGGEAVGHVLIELMEHHEAGIRALAASFSGLKGIPSTLMTRPLRKRFLSDDDLVVKMAAATFAIRVIYMMQILNHMPQMIALQSESY